MREYAKALEATQQATEQDSDGQHAKEIQQQEFKIQQELYTQRGSESQEETLARAMRDPEVAVSCNASFTVRSCLTATVLEYHDGPRNAADPTASAGRPRCSPRAFEEPHCALKDSEIDQRRHYQDSISRS